MNTEETIVKNNDDFTRYMDAFKELTTEEKEKEVLEHLKFLSSYCNLMCKETNIDNEIIMNKELLDTEKQPFSVDDLLESIIVYTNSIQNSLDDYNIGVDEYLDNLMN